MSATESLNGRENMARRKVENGIFSARLDFPLPSLLPPWFLACKTGVIFSRFTGEVSKKRETWALGKDTLTLARVQCAPLRFVLRSTYSAGGLRFLSHVTWKIVGKLRRYFTSFPGCQSSAPKMPRQRRETVTERRGLSKCLKEHQHNGWFT